MTKVARLQEPDSHRACYLGIADVSCAYTIFYCIFFGGYLHSIPPDVQFRRAAYYIPV